MNDILEFRFHPIFDRWRLAFHVLFGYSHILERHQSAAEQLRTAIHRLARDDAHANQILEDLEKSLHR